MEGPSGLARSIGDTFWYVRSVSSEVERGSFVMSKRCQLTGHQLTSDGRMSVERWISARSDEPTGPATDGGRPGPRHGAERSSGQVRPGSYASWSVAKPTRRIGGRHVRGSTALKAAWSLDVADGSRKDGANVRLGVVERGRRRSSGTVSHDSKGLRDAEEREFPARRWM
ncbi:hypothetical protein BIFADO_01537 [Bifidobacterium adolescentis L2-32]|uniref:Uncharacterized protein n=1 Tax=Bifidobacterium adolescentis L2-32 TaxID=411481 RepID=A7A6Q4_BIFAD|nr:hypothetical protein BIFADO_01537 [Bifidobacterium adolescentis L2-32]